MDSAVSVILIHWIEVYPVFEKLKTRNQPRNRTFQEETSFKPEEQAIVPKMNGNDKRSAQKQQCQELLISCGSSVPVDVNLTRVGCQVLFYGVFQFEFNRSVLMRMIAIPRGSKIINE